LQIYRIVVFSTTPPRQNDNKEHPMKAQGNITLGKTADRHIAAGTLVPFSVVRFYGPGIPERVLGEDVFVTGWYNNNHGGLTFTIRKQSGSSDALVLGPNAKVGVYVDQADAKADFDS